MKIKETKTLDGINYSIITYYNDVVIFEVTDPLTGETLNKEVRKRGTVTELPDDGGDICHIDGIHGDPNNLANMLNNFGEEEKL